MITKERNVFKTCSFFILFFYLSVLLIFQAINNNVQITWMFACFLVAISFIFTQIIKGIFANRIRHQYQTSTSNQKRKVYVGLVIFLFTLIFFVIYLLGQYPGGMSPDTVNQYSQALSSQYNDWHPALHTILFFTLPLKTGHHLGFIVSLQLLYFSIAFGYLMYVIYRNGCSFISLIGICIYVWVNPFLASYMMYPW